MKIEYSCLTDKGVVREINEDSILCKDQIINMHDHYESEKIAEELLSENIHYFAVADGMGGHDAGEVASRLTLEKILNNFQKDAVLYLDNTDKLKQMILSVHDEINEFADMNNNKGMGTTLVGTIFNKDKFLAFNIGDSRLYIFRDGYLAQKTRDHSLAEQVGGNVPKNYITSSIGGGYKDITIDIFDLTGKIKNNDLIIICSDGLTDFNMDKYYDDIESLISTNKNDLKKLNNSLLDFAIERGSADNISVISILLND
ncbi:MAG TPA: protein phosphatase 2C domain-containing protein [Spirochaetota bacterium]|nr:protein phosphatase 2C domain-containing protein [Spirochaetota bacterium]